MDGKGREIVQDDKGTKFGWRRAGLVSPGLQSRALELIWISGVHHSY